MAWKNGWKAACGALLMLAALGPSPADAVREETGPPQPPPVQRIDVA